MTDRQTDQYDKAKLENEYLQRIDRDGEPNCTPEHGCNNEIRNLNS